MQFVRMAFHRCCGGYPTAQMMRRRKEKKSATNKSTIITVLLTLMTMTVIDINYQVACSPMVESPSPSPWPWSTPSSSSPPLPSSPPLLSTSDELDSDASRKVLGSSVVTSVSVVMNSSDGKSNTSTTPTAAFEAISPVGNTPSSASSSNVGNVDSDVDNGNVITVTTRVAKPPSSDDGDGGRMDSAQLKSNLIASPGNLLNPDKYEFYTFDEAGDLVKRLMSWDEIQGLIAASDTDGLLGEAVVPIYYNENIHHSNGDTNGGGSGVIPDKLHDTRLTANEFQTSDIQDVRKVVESVQNVLKSELAAVASSPSKIMPMAVKPSSTHSNPPNWSSLFLPNFLENLDEAAFVDLQQHNQHLSSNDLSGTMSQSPIQHYSTSDKFFNPTITNIAATPINSQPTLQALASASTSTMIDNTSKQSVYTTQSADVTLKNSITLPPAHKFTRIKNTATKPIHFKYSSSTTSERVWSSPNLLVSEEKPTKNFTTNSYRPSLQSSSSSSSSSSLPSAAAASSFSTHSHISHTPSSMVTSWPVKSYSTTKLATGAALKTTPAAAADKSTATSVDTATVKTTTTMFTMANENSTVSQQGTTVTTNRDSFTAALTNLLNQINNDQRQTLKVKPSVDSFIYNSLKTTAEMAEVTTHNQRNTSTVNSVLSAPLVDKDKYHITSSHAQPSSWSDSLRNGTEKDSAGVSQVRVSATTMMTTTTLTPPSSQDTRYTNNSISHMGGNLATKILAGQYQQHQFMNANNIKRENSTESSPLSHKQSQFSAAAAGTNSYPSTTSWMSKGNRVSSNTAIASSTITPATGKFNPFSSYLTGTTTKTTLTAATFAHTTPTTNNALSSIKVSGGGQGQGQSTTTTAEPLVTWISTNNFENQQWENKNPNNWQILDSDKLVTEQYVSGTAPVVVTNEHVVLSSQPFTKTTVSSTTFSDGKTNAHTDGKMPAAATFSPLHHTWLSATNTEPSTNLIQQQTYSHRVNAVNNNNNTNINNVESKTAISLSNSNNNLPNHHLQQQNHHHYYHHHNQPLHQQNYHQQQQQLHPNRNTATTFNSYYHRPSAGSGVSSTTVTDATDLKYTKTWPSPLNTTVANEMVMQRVPTLDPPNKITSTFVTNSGLGSDAMETNENRINEDSAQNILWTTKSAPYHSSTESVKNLTQIAVMLNKSNSTQVTMMKNSFNKNAATAEMKHKPTAKPNRTATWPLSSHHFFDSSATVAAANNPNSKYHSNNNNNEDKAQATVKPINVEFLNDCITSLISNSMGSSGVGSGGSSGSGNNDERETWQSLSHNGNAGYITNASHNNHHQHYNLHYHIDDKEDDDNRNKDYHSTVSNSGNFFSRDQNKHSPSSSSGSVTSPVPGTTTHAVAAAASTWDTFQHKVTLSSAAAGGEKQKENSHIYYYKLPPINSQPLKANADTMAVHSSSPSTAGYAYSPTMTTTTSSSSSTTTTRTTVNPNGMSTAADKIYQKITTIDRSPSSPSSSNLSSNELLDGNRSTWKQNMVAISTTASSTSLQSLLHTEARVSGASTTEVENTMITRNTEDAVSAANLENREASAVTFDQVVHSNLSQFGESSHNSTKLDHRDNVKPNSSTAVAFPHTATSSYNASATTKRAEPFATPQLVATSSNMSAKSEATVEPTTPIASDTEFSDLRKDYVSQHNDDVSVVITNDGGAGDDDDNNNNVGGSADNNDDDDDDDDDDDNDEGDDEENEALIKEQKGEGGDKEQGNRQSEDHRYKGDDNALTTKNQRIANVTAAQFGQFDRKTTSSDSFLKDRIRTNVANRNFTNSNLERHDILVTTSSQKAGSFSGAASALSKPGDVKNNASIAGVTASSGTASNLADDSVEFVRIKLENRTTQSLNDATTTSTATAIIKQKDEKNKITLAKNQPSKQSSTTSTMTMSTVGAMGTTTAAIAVTSFPPMTNLGSVFRSPVATSSFIRPLSSIAGPNGLSNTATPSVVATSTTTTATTASPWPTSGNGNSNTAPTVVELHPAPHENMGLEASVAYLGDDVKTFIDLCNELSFKIWTSQTAKSLTTSRSIVLSPFALLSTLAMIFLGARGSSSGIMNDFLRLDDMVTFNPHQVFRNITESAINSKNTGAANIAFVRQVFSDKTKGNVLEFYKERLQQYYDTYVEEINFNVIGDLLRRRTNLLVKRQTHGRIQDYLRGSTIAMKPPLATFTANIFQTDCSIASTEGRDGEMYFVVRPSTRQRRLVPIPAVVYRGSFLAGYEPGLDATAVTLSPESIMSTILVLPGQQGQVAPGDGLARLEQRLLESSYRRGAWSRLLRSLLFRHGLEVQIPRFSHKSILNLTVGLQKMGMGEIFAPDKADLRGINGLLNELHMSDCVQANTFSTCGEESVGARHHVETFPSFAQRAGAGTGTGTGTGGSTSARQVGNRALLPEFDQQPWPVRKMAPPPPPPLSSRPRQARLPDNPRLRFDRPFLYIVRHNPTGMILYIGRFNPRLLP